MNNSAVAKEALKSFSSRYTDASFFDIIDNAKQDISADKSEEIAAYLEEASDNLYRSNKSAYLVEGDHVVNVVQNGDDWEPSFEEGFTSFVFDCAGVPVSY